MKDYVIRVDEHGNDRGFIGKLEAHLGDGVLHSAFSVFVFNDFKELLVTRRSENKMLWSNYWSNTCCSHPLYYEDILIAGRRRLYEELGFSCDLKFLYNFRYCAKYIDSDGDLLGSENELCSVLIGKSNEIPDLNSSFVQEEICDFEYIGIDDLMVNIKKSSKMYTPWFKMEVKELSKNYSGELERLFK